MNDSSENVGQDAILSHEFSSFPGGLIKLVNDSSEKVWGRFPTCPQQACGAGWKPAPHFFIVSGRRSRHERLLRKSSASGPRLRGFGMGRDDKAAQPRPACATLVADFH